MKRNAWLVLALLSLGGFAGLAEAQKTKGQKPLELKIVRVNDRRTNGSFSRLGIAVELPGIRTAEVAASRVLLQAATDDTGKALVIESDEEPRMEENGMLAYLDAEEAQRPMATTIEMQNPARGASSIAEVRGEIELLIPSRDPNSVALIPKFLGQSGKKLSHKALKANGVEIAVVSRAQLEAEKKKLVDARRKELAASGYEGEELETQASYVAEYLFTPEEGDVLLRITDPKKRVESIGYVDAAGEVKRAMLSERDGMSVLSMWEGTPQPDWSLKVNLKTAKSVVRYPIALKDVPLP